MSAPPKPVSALTAWLSLAACPKGSVERALAYLLRAMGKQAVAAMLVVSEDEVSGWIVALKVPAKHGPALVAERARRKGEEVAFAEQAKSPRVGQWAVYRAEAAAQGYGSLAEIAARHGVSRQAVHKAIALDPEPEPVAPPAGKKSKKKGGG